MTPPETLPLPLEFAAETSRNVALDPGAMLLGGFARAQDTALLAQLAEIAEISPFRQMVTPSGWKMSVAMTNCGKAGWVTDRTGYRYDPIDRQTGQPWPTMPDSFAQLATDAAAQAGFPDFVPDACLINRYEPGARLSLHQDKDERDFEQPIVSVSLGLPAIFLWGGQKRTERPRRIALAHGDIVVWGGPARMNYHGVHELAAGEHLLTGAVRYNITFRKAL